MLFIPPVSCDFGLIGMVEDVFNAWIDKVDVSGLVG
jgi:hypothetical protein